MYVVYLVVLGWSLYDIWKGSLDQGKKVLWTILCIFLGVIGTLIYVMAGKKK